jgi:hypothetical protein
VKR